MKGEDTSGVHLWLVLWKAASAEKQARASPAQAAPVAFAWLTAAALKRMLSKGTTTKTMIKQEDGEAEEEESLANLRLPAVV